MKNKAASLVVLALAVGVALYVYTARTASPQANVTTQPFSRGDIVESVSATGTLEAVETVEVGTRSPAWFASSMPTSIRSFARGR